MVIRFITTLEEKLSQIPIKDGQIISIQDKNMWCYDMFDVRHTITGGLDTAGLTLIHNKTTNSLDLTYEGTVISSIQIDALSGSQCIVTIKENDIVKGSFKVNGSEDVEINLTGGSGADGSIVTPEDNGLMSAQDKVKLDMFGQGYVIAGQKAGTVIGDRATAEGVNTEASSKASHAEGLATVSAGIGSHSEGNGATARGNYAHAENVFTVASGTGAHAEGNGATASGDYSHAEGSTTFAEAQSSHAEGDSTKAQGKYSHASGDTTVAYAQSMTAIGMYNVHKTATENVVDDLLIVGNGSPTARSNAFRIDKNGASYGKAEFNGSGADYAEYFEWEDGNPTNEDLRGYFVTLINNKIKKANTNDFILGIISANPVVIGNSDPDNWHDKYMKDDFGCYIKETVTKEIKVGTDEHGNEIIKQTKYDSYIINPDFDESKAEQYISRKDRPEWQPVGLIGQLIVRDDGSCQVGKRCKVADGGVGTHSETEGYHVLKRINNNLVQVYFK